MFNFIFQGKKNLFLFVGLIALILLLVLIQVFSGPAQVTQPPQASALPSQNPQIQNNLPSAAPIESQPSPATPYQTENLNKDYQRIINHPPVSGSDKTVRDNLIASLNNQSGILAKTSGYTIEYVKAPDSFMVEITTEDTEKAKLDTQNWFKEKGLSDAGICNLPVVFYISRQINSALLEKGKEFNPIPEACQ